VTQKNPSPVPGKENRRAGKVWTMNHTPNEQPVQRLGEIFAGQVIEAERALLSAGIWDQPGLNDEAYRQGLRADHFVLPEHQFLFWYLCVSAECGRTPSDIYADTLKWARIAGVTLDASDLRYIVATDHDPRLWTEYVATVRDNAGQFERARECFSEGGTILTGLLADQFDVLIRPRRKVSHRWHCTEAA